MTLAISSTTVKRQPALLTQSLPTTQAQWTQFVNSMQEWYQSIQSSQSAPNVLPAQYSVFGQTGLPPFVATSCTATQDSTHALYAPQSLKVLVTNAGATLAFTGFPVAIQPGQLWYCAFQVYGAFNGSLSLSTSAGTTVSSGVATNASGWNLVWTLLDLTGHPDTQATWIITFATPGTFWLDGLQMSPAGSPFLQQPPFVVGTGSVPAGSAISGGIPAPGSITGGMIAPVTITAVNIAPVTITAAQIAPVAITAAQIAPVTITAAQIANGTISSGNMLVTGKGSALNDDPQTSDITAWTPPYGTSTPISVVNLTDGKVGKTALQNTSGTYSSGKSRTFSLDASKTYVVSCWARTLSGTGTLYIECAQLNAAGTITGFTLGLDAITVPGAWTYYSATLNPRSDTAFGYLLAEIDFLTGSAIIQVQSFQIQQQISSELIVNGAVTALKIAANSITAQQIAANTITSQQIAAGSILADRIASNSITSLQIAANTITAQDIAANTITGDRLAANTITAGQIAANTITTNQIAAGTILGDRIAANTITAGNIAANTITAAKMSVGTLSAITANMGTITAGTIIFNNGSFMKVIGLGFGAQANLIEWYGPSFASIASCTKANAKYYIGTDGTSFFSGATGQVSSASGLNGFYKHPPDSTGRVYIDQWGVWSTIFNQHGDSTWSPNDVTFFIPFPTACLNAQAVPKDNSQNFNIGTLSRGSFVLNFFNATNDQFYWRAFGY